jgi:hypothetical protein
MWHPGLMAVSKCELYNRITLGTYQLYALKLEVSLVSDLLYMAFGDW